MPLLDALLLGLVQGLTEFLPVSSDGHLALAGLLMGHDPAEAGGIFFDLLLHLATMVAVIVWFRRDLWELRLALSRGERGTAARRVALLVVVASVPTAVVGLTLQRACERAFGVPLYVGFGFLATAVVLLAAHAVMRRHPEMPAEPAWDRLAGIRIVDALAIGAAQGVAPWPGLSRSGVTIATAVALGVDGATAARFSLLVSLPAIGGAFLLKLRDLDAVPAGMGSMAAGFVVAGIVGYLAIGWLVAIARRAKLLPFAAYTAALGLIVIALALARTA